MDDPTAILALSPAIFSLTERRRISWLACQLRRQPIADSNEPMTITESFDGRLCALRQMIRWTEPQPSTHSEASPSLLSLLCKLHSQTQRKSHSRTDGSGGGGGRADDLLWRPLIDSITEYATALQTTDPQRHPPLDGDPPTATATPADSSGPQTPPTPRQPPINMTQQRRRHATAESALCVLHSLYQSYAATPCDDEHLSDGDDDDGDGDDSGDAVGGGDVGFEALFAFGGGCDGDDYLYEDDDGSANTMRPLSGTHSVAVPAPKPQSEVFTPLFRLRTPQLKIAAVADSLQSVSSSAAEPIPTPTPSQTPITTAESQSASTQSDAAEDESLAVPAIVALTRALATRLCRHPARVAIGCAPPQTRTELWSVLHSALQCLCLAAAAERIANQNANTSAQKLLRLSDDFATNRSISTSQTPRPQSSATTDTAPVSPSISHTSLPLSTEPSQPLVVATDPSQPPPEATTTPPSVQPPKRKRGRPPKKPKPPPSPSPAAATDNAAPTADGDERHKRLKADAAVAPAPNSPQPPLSATHTPIVTPTADSLVSNPSESGAVERLLCSVCISVLANEPSASESTAAAFPVSELLTDWLEGLLAVPHSTDSSVGDQPPTDGDSAAPEERTSTAAAQQISRRILENVTDRRFSFDGTPDDGLLLIDTLFAIATAESPEPAIDGSVPSDLYAAANTALAALDHLLWSQRTMSGQWLRPSAVCNHQSVVRHLLLQHWAVFRQTRTANQSTTGSESAATVSESGGNSTAAPKTTLQRLVAMLESTVSKVPNRRGWERLRRLTSILAALLCASPFAHILRPLVTAANHSPLGSIGGQWLRTLLSLTRTAFHSHHRLRCRRRTANGLPIMPAVNREDRRICAVATTAALLLSQTIVDLCDRIVAERERGAAATAASDVVLLAAVESELVTVAAAAGCCSHTAAVARLLTIGLHEISRVLSTH